MPVDNTDFIAHARVTDPDEDLTVYLAAAKSKARAAGIPDYKNNALYDLFIIDLALMYYDNRGMSSSANNPEAFERAAQARINSFVLALRYAGEDPENEKQEEDEPDED